MTTNSKSVNVVQNINEGRSPALPTLARRQLLADRLVEIAAATIAAAGLPELRARTLADAAGCSVGAIYSVFPDLDELVLAVNLRTLDAIDAAMTQAATPDVTPAEQMVRLAAAYLQHALVDRLRWAALFQHRMASGRALPDWYAARLDAAFTHIEAPLEMLRPELDTAARARLSRTVFAAVHGVVSLGLDSRSVQVPPEVLHDQLRIVVSALAAGLAAAAA